MNETRRHFLERAARAAIVFGLPALGLRRSETTSVASQEAPAAPHPVEFERALAQMRADRKPGIAIRFPDDEETRESLVRSLDLLLASWRPEFGRLRGGPDSLAFEVFLEAVFVCMESRALDSSVRGVRSDDDLVLFDAEGNRVDGLPCPPDRADVPRALGARLRSLLHGPRFERLRARADAARRAAPPAARAAFDALAGATGLLTPERYRQLWRNHPVLTPALVLTAHFARGEFARMQAGWLLRDAFGVLDETVPGTALPFGLEIAEASRFAGCGVRPGQEAVFDCGMAQSTPATRRFIGMLTR